MVQRELVIRIACSQAADVQRRCETAPIQVLVVTTHQALHQRGILAVPGLAVGVTQRCLIIQVFHYPRQQGFVQGLGRQLFEQACPQLLQLLGMALTLLTVIQVQ
jgi:hypothetical protein